MYYSFDLEKLFTKQGPSISTGFFFKHGKILKCVISSSRKIIACEKKFQSIIEMYDKSTKFTILCSKRSIVMKNFSCNTIFEEFLCIPEFLIAIWDTFLLKQKINKILYAIRNKKLLHDANCSCQNYFRMN